MKTIIVLCLIVLCLTAGCVQTAEEIKEDVEDQQYADQQAQTYTTDPKVVINVTTS